MGMKARESAALNFSGLKLRTLTVRKRQWIPEIDEGDPDPHETLWRGEGLLAAGDYEGAYDAFCLLEDATPSTDELLDLWGVDEDGSHQQYRLDEARVAIGLAVSLLGRGLRDRAISTLAFLVDDEPAVVDALVDAATVANYMNETSLARALALRALDHAPKDKAARAIADASSSAEPIVDPDAQVAWSEPSQLRVFVSEKKTVARAVEDYRHTPSFDSPLLFEANFDAAPRPSLCSPDQFREEVGSFRRRRLSKQVKQELARMDEWLCAREGVWVIYLHE